MTSLLKPKAATTPIPQQAAFETQIDNVAGTKVERVKQPDGTYALVQSSLALSPEDQAMQDAWQRIAQDSLAYIDKLSNSYNRADVPWLDEYLTNYETSQTEAIDRAGLARTTAEEKALARFGQADSTAATQARAQRSSDIVDQRVQVQREMSGIEQDARNQAINQQAGLYDIATGELENQRQTQLGSLSRLVSTGLNQQAASQNYNNSVAATIGANNKAKAEASQAGLSNLAGVASLAAAPFTGGASLALMPAASGSSSFLNSSLLAALNKGGGWQSYSDGTRIKWS